MFSFKQKSRVIGTVTDITNYVTNCQWSGEIDQAARRIDFSIAYNLKDKGFVNQNILVGDTIFMYWTDPDNKSAGPIEIFRGIVFMRNRSTQQYTFEYTAYDRLIYLAKSKTTRKFSNITVETLIQQICNDNGLTVGEVCSIGTTVNFIADNMSYTEILKKAFSAAYTQNSTLYHYYLNQDKLYVIKQSQVIENYTATDSVNVDHSQHSESIENMVNTVVIVNDAGDQTGSVNNQTDVDAYGKIQTVYKVEAKKNTEQEAKALLKTVEFKSSLSAVGNVQCITGYAITVQEEQLKGVFTIKSDRHSIENGVHNMELELEFLKVVS